MVTTHPWGVCVGVGGGGSSERRAATIANQARRGKDEARAASGRNLVEPSRGRRRRVKGKLYGSEAPLCTGRSTLIVSLHGRRRQSSGSCGGKAPPRASSATLSLHDHWRPKTELKTHLP
jgi:hypothetical protein